jgi:hypothetical protein
VIQMLVLTLTLRRKAGREGASPGL